MSAPQITQQMEAPHQASQSLGNRFHLHGPGFVVGVAPGRLCCPSLASDTLWGLAGGCLADMARYIHQGQAPFCSF